MSHDATKILMGNVSNSFKVIENHAGSIAAGLACRLKSDDTITTAEADGNLLGISVGKDLSDTSRTPICRKGTKVPILLTAAFSPTIGTPVKIDATTGKASTDGTLVNATYISTALTAILEDGTEVASGAAYIDFPGGL